MLTKFFASLFAFMLASTLYEHSNQNTQNQYIGIRQSTLFLVDALVTRNQFLQNKQLSQTNNSISEEQLVQNDVSKMVMAVYAGDVNTTLSYTHPKIISMMGGMSRAKDSLEKTLSQLLSLNMEIDSFSFPQAPTFLESKNMRFVIVPTEMVVSSNGQQIKSLNYQFGIQEKGSDQWKYIEGSRINKQNVNLLFPDFPSDYNFPMIYRKKI